MKRSGNRRIPNLYAENKDRDDDLILFRDMQKRDKERNVSLLQPIPTDDLESNSGNFPLFRIASAKKFGFDFLHDSEKNDYDWLKTPPATPLFASLEMDAGTPELVVQRELPIMANLSRFSGTPHDVLKINPRSKSPDPMAKALTRSFAQHMKHHASPPWTDTKSINDRGTQTQASIASTNGRSSNILLVTSELKSQLEDPFKPLRSKTDKGLTAIVSPPEMTRAGFSDETPPNLITTRSTSTTRGRPTTPSLVDHPSANRSTSTTRGRPITPSLVDHPSANCSISTTRGQPTTPSTSRSSSTTKARATAPSINSRPREAIDRTSDITVTSTKRSSSTRGRPTVGSPPKYVVTSSDETPPNLITNRPPSISRTRPTTPSTKKIQKQEPVHSRRQSCSPSMSRGRKLESNNLNGEADSTLYTKKKFQSANGSLAFGSSMVEKVMNARKSVSEDAERKAKARTTTTTITTHDHLGFGRLISKGSIDMGPRNKSTEVKRDPVKVSQTNSLKPANTISVWKQLNNAKCIKPKTSGKGRRQEDPQKRRSHNKIHVTRMLTLFDYGECQNGLQNA